jgi:pimeloyl-ACP methyl ester carboxylesterase
MGDLISPLLLSSHMVVRRRMKTIYAKENTHLFDEERLRAHHRPLRAANTQRAVLRTLRGWRAERIEQEAHRIKQPSLLIWGAADLEIPLAHGRRLFELIPNSRLIVFRRCGHMPMEERPREFTEVVVDFCSDAREVPMHQGASA